MGREKNWGGIGKIYPYLRIIEAMGFVIGSKQFEEILAKANAVTPSKAILPIIQNVFMEYKDGEIRVQATDNESTLELRSQVQPVDNSALPFKAVIPIKDLLSTLKLLPEQPLTIEWKQESNQLIVHTATGQYSLESQNPDEFPEKLMPEPTHTFHINTQVLIRAIEKTHAFASSSDQKPNLMGIYFEIGPDGANFVATDGHRLALYSRSDFAMESPISLLIPARNLKQLVGFLSGQLVEVIKVGYTETSIIFEMENMSFSLRLIDARFPDYKSVLPQEEQPHRATIYKDEFIKALKRIENFSNKTNYLVSLQFFPEQLEIVTENPISKTAGQERIPLTFHGEQGFRIGFNSKYLIQAADHIDSEELVLTMESPGRAAVMKPVDQQNDENLLFLIMPLMLQDLEY